MCECYLHRLHGAEEGAFRKGQNFYSESGKGSGRMHRCPSSLLMTKRLPVIREHWGFKSIPTIPPSPTHFPPCLVSPVKLPLLGPAY